jgi:hypothetical protein
VWRWCGSTWTTQGDDPHGDRREWPFALPAGRRGLEEFDGIIHTKDLLDQLARTGKLDIAASLRQPLVVHEGTQVLKLLEMFRENPVHMAIVVDEYGVVEGIVTPTDILVAIAGDMPESSADLEQTAVRRDDGSWLMDGMIGIHEAERLLERRSMRGDEDFETLAGFVLARFGQIPQPATISPGRACASRSSTWTAAASTRCSSRLIQSRRSRAGKRSSLTRFRPRILHPVPQDRRAESGRMQQPNILIVMVDQLNGTFFPDGPADFLHAPVLKQLAARSARFNANYCASPLCAPSRAAFMSGQLPSRDRRLRQRSRVFPPPSDLCPPPAAARLPHGAMRQDAFCRSRSAARVRRAAHDGHLSRRFWLDARLDQAGRTHRLVVS